MVNFREHLRIIVGRIVRFQLVLLAIAAFMCVFFGRFTLGAFGFYWALLGASIICFSTLSLMGGWGSLRSFEYQYGMTIGQGVVERTNSIQNELHRGETFLFSTFAQAIWAVIGGFLLNMIAG